MEKPFGFNQTREEQLTPLEETLGFRFIDKDEDPYAHHLRKPVRVTVNGKSFAGVYQGTIKRTHLVLLPFVQIETYPSEGRNIDVCFWENERPQILELQSVSRVEPVRREYLDWLVESSPQKPTSQEFSDGDGI
jgi:hypothetical protein